MTQKTSHNPALLFDLDGTLIDSVYQHVLAWHEALEELGLKKENTTLQRPNANYRA